MPLRHTADADPILDMPWEIRRGLVIDGKRDLRALIYRHGEQFCGQMNARSHYTCTRPMGHPDWWKHVAADGYEILSVWAGAANPPNDGELIDPEDGSPADPAEVTVTKNDLVIGGVYKLRDRVNKLQVIGGLDDVMPRQDGWIEVLDFTKRDQRAVPVEEIVPVEGLTLTLDELGWTIDFAQALRLKIRDQAVDNYHKGKWCANGLQDGLRDLGLPKYEPQQTGKLVITVPYVALSHAGTSEVKKAFEDALGPELLAAIKAVQVDPENDNEIELRNADVTVGIMEVNRR